MTSYFKIEDISLPLRDQMTKIGVWKKDCPVSMDELKYLTILHYDFTGDMQIGEIVVHYSMATGVIKIFQELLAIKFPIAKIKLIDHYQGNDDDSMEDNNSSCFNYRTIAGTNILSMHAYGLAIDINPVQNPYIIFNQSDGTKKIYPSKGQDYLDRKNMRKGMVENIKPIFAKHGFDEWGGDWHEVLDYQHFQVARNKVKTYS